MLEGNISAAIKTEDLGHLSDVKSLVINKNVKLSEEEAIEFLGNWNLSATYTLLDLEDFYLTPINVSQRLNILAGEAENLIETLKSMGLIEATEVEGKYNAVPLHFDDSFVASADLLSLYSKVSQKSLSRLTSKDIFSFRFEAMSKKVIQKYQAEINGLLVKIAEESKGKNDCELYATGFFFSKISRNRKDK